MIKHVWAKVAAVACTAALIVAGTVVGGTAAQAATLATGNSMYELNCDSGLPYTLLSVDPTTGDMTGAGTRTDIQNDCFGQGAWDPVSGYVYGLDWEYGSEALVQIDVTTGERTVIGNFYDIGNSSTVDPYSIAIDDNGNAYVLAHYAIYSLDLSSGFVAYIDSTNISCPYASAFDSNGTLYVAEYGNCSDPIVYTMSTTDGSTTQIGDWYTATNNGGDATSYAISFQFDSNGVLWVEDDNGPLTLWSVSDMSDFNNTANLESTLNYNADNSLYVESLLITRGTVTNPTAGAPGTPGTLYNLNCDSTNPYVLSSLDTSTAAATGIGNMTYNGSTCFGQAAWDASTKTGYVVDWNYNSNALSRINFETGQVTLVNEFNNAADPTQDYSVDSIAINSKGEAYATYNGFLYSLDLATGGMTDIGLVSSTNYYALAFDPTTDKLYAADYTTNDIVEINTTDASSTVVGSSSVLTDPYVYSMAFTETGALYFVDDSDNLYKATSAANVAGATLIGGTTIDGRDYFTESLVYVPVVPSLPDTGLNGVSATVGGLSVVFLIAAGAVLLVVRRRMAQK